MMPRTFGYSPERAESLSNSIDSDMALINYATRRLTQRVVGAGAITSRADDFLEGMREMVSDLHDVVDERTEGDRS